MKKIKFASLVVAILSTTLCAATADPTYLNDLRRQTGLKGFESNSLLDTAAELHSQYLKDHGTAGHYEEEGGSDSHGYGPVDRTMDAGYLSRMVSENVSYASNGSTVKSSVDGLFSAIYHRFGFLSLERDEIGIGISDDQTRHTYDMGNSELNKLCKEDSGSSDRTEICKDKNHGATNDKFNQSKDYLKSDAPKLILWPPVGGSDIPPVFYEELPDPLPEHSVSGYPISVQFNDAKFSSAPNNIKLSLKDAEENDIDHILQMDKDNDPSTPTHFTEYEFALFPKARLEWGSKYFATLSYNGGQEERWCFVTRSLSKYAERVYRIADGGNGDFSVVSGKKYAIYLVPQNQNDKFNTYGVNSNIADEAHRIVKFIDWNTLLVSATGNTGNYIEITTDNNQTIKLTIASQDSASNPSEDKCDASDSSISDTSIPDNSDNTSEGNSEDEEEGSNGKSGGISGGGCTYNPNHTGFDGTMLLMILLAMLYPLLKKREEI